MNFTPMQVGPSVNRPYCKSTPPPGRPASCTDFEKIRLLAQESMTSPTLRYKKVILNHKKVCDLRAQVVKEKDKPNPEKVTPCKRKIEPKQERVLSCCEIIWSVVEAHMEYIGRYPSVDNYSGYVMRFSR